MSKSYGNYIGVTEPPEEIFGKTMRVPDDAMGTYYELLAGTKPDPELKPVEQKRALARLLVDRFHGPGAAEAAEQHFDRVHRDHQAPEHVEEVEVSRGGLPDGVVHLPALLADHFGVSRSEARRLLGGGGVRLDGAPLDPGELDVEAGRLDGGVLQVGRRKFRRIRVTA
jgi:tyrosyl-tRNA synthetase